MTNYSDVSDAKLVEQGGGKLSPSRDGVTSRRRGGASMSNQIDTNNAMTESQRRSDIAPPVDCSAEAVKSQDGRPFPFYSDVCALNMRVNNSAAFTRRSGPRPRIDPDHISQERGDDSNETD